MLYLVIFFILACLFTAVLLVKVNIVIEFLKNGKNDHCIISIFALYGKIKFKYEIPFLSMDTEEVKMKVVKERGAKEKDTSKKKSKITFSQIIEQYKVFNEFYKKNETLLCNIKEYIIGKIAITNFRLDIIVGAGEAHYTAILTGILWSACGLLLSFFSNIMLIKKEKITIKSDFNQNKFWVDFYCIITFKIVHIIVVGLKLLSYYIRGKIDFKNKALGGGISG